MNKNDIIEYQNELYKIEDIQTDTQYIDLINILNDNILTLTFEDEIIKLSPKEANIKLYKKILNNN